MSKKIKGIPAASGIGIGRAHLISLGMEELKVLKRSIPKDKIPQEIVRLEEALFNTREELVQLRKKIAEEMGLSHAEIFDAHLLVLEDRTLIEDVIRQIEKDRINVEHAFNSSLQRYVEIFRKIEDEYLRERVYDIQDVGRRVLRNLLKKEKKTLEEIKHPGVIVAHDLSPSQTASLRKEKISGFVTDVGGRTSHTAIIARSLGIPAVVGTELATKYINPQDHIIVDGYNGVVIINPTEEEKAYYRKEKHRRERLVKKFIFTKKLIPQTRDKKKIIVAANIEFPEELPLVLDFGAQGVGLYRTEYFYMNRTEPPSEEEQFRAYIEVAKRVHPYRVVIRTLDLGGDKFLSPVAVPKEMQSFLGWRAIRFCLARPDIFKTQLKAILRAASEGNLGLMYPMISGVDELLKANDILEEAKEELRRENKPFREDVEVGAMIEVPSAALLSEFLADYVDFFSIGTNDLIQYALAVDRADEKVAYLYEPAHPAVLKLIKNVIESALKKGIKVGMCGEMASEPVFIYILLGMGLQEFSMPPSLVPRAKLLISSLYYKDAQETALKALEMKSGKEVESFCNKKLKSLLGSDYERIVI